MTSSASLPQDQTYCSSNGFKQEVKCAIKGVNWTDASSHYMTYQSCPVVPGDFTNFMKFEVPLPLALCASESADSDAVTRSSL